MKRSTERILTTHVGSLARPQDLLEMTRAKLAGEPYDAAAFNARVRSSVAELVAKQAECGVDVVDDGEQSKDSFYAYARERLGGIEAVVPERGGARATSAEVRAFPEYYRDYYGRRSQGRTGPDLSLVCTGPVTYTGQEAVQTDIANLRAALAGKQVEEAFIPATAPRVMGGNRYYKSDEEYLNAVAEAMHEEYKAIADAGFLVQIDDPALTTIYEREELGDRAAQRRWAEMYIEALNHALDGVPTERVRYHTCYGINEGPRTHDVPLRELIDLILTIDAQAYSFEAANARHEHEWRVFEEVKLPAGKAIIPGVITHTSNVVEHPEAIADRIERFARVVGRENVIAGADCGFSSQASFTPDVHPTVVWAKFQALAEGAALATKRLWRAAT
jgi:5-methyltetrahydropteroyltriglutamate--homocysteine methyltransferase